MSWTKGELVDQAFAELALAGYVFDLTPEERQAACTRLDAMMATWNARGIVLPYALALTPGDANLDAECGLPAWAVEATYLHLALRTAASKGKAAPQTLKATASEAMAAVDSRLAHDDLNEQQFRSGTPKGQGSKPWRATNNPFLQQPNSGELRQTASGALDFIEGA